MKKNIFIPVISIICAAVLLFGLSFGLKNLEEINAEKENLKIMQTLLPGSKEFEKIEYTGKDANIRSVYESEGYGCVVETVTAGYAGDIRMLIGVNTNGRVTGLVVRDMSETAGLGMEALNDTDFLGQFLNKTGDFQVGTNVDAITGATVTSKAITRSVKSAVAYATGTDQLPETDADSGATS